MVSQHIIDIIVKAQDQASATVQKVEDAFKKVGPSAQNSMDKASNAMQKFENTAEGLPDTFEELEQKVAELSRNGINGFNQLTQAERELLTNVSSAKSKMAELGSQLTNTGTTGMNAFNQLTSAERNALVQLSQMSSKTSATSSQMNSAWERVKTKVGTVATTIKTKFSESLSSAKSKVESLGNSFSGLNGVITGALGAIGMANFQQLTVGLAMTRERMTALTSATMGSKSAADDFIASMNTMTNESLVSLNDLGQAMNTIKMSTGMSNEQLKSFSTTVNDIGQRAILMGKDSNEAMTLMQAAGQGLNGEFDVLKSNFGITKEKLMDLGWSGAADDVEGYQRALEEALEQGGSMDEMMDTTPGKLKQVEKGFTTAGRQIGEQFLPYIDQTLDFMLGLKEDCPEAYTAMVGIGGAFSAVATVLPMISPFIDTFNQFSTTLKNVKDGFSTVKDSISSAKDKFSEFKQKIQELRSSDSISNLKDKFSTLKGKIGEIPGKLSELKGKLKELSATDLVTSLKDKFGGLKSKITDAGTALMGYGRKAGAAAIKVAGLVLGVSADTIAKQAEAVATGEVSIAQGILNTVMDANPVMIIVLAIIALIAALVYLYYNCEPVRNALNQLFDILKEVGSWLYDSFIQAWNQLTEALQPVYELVMSMLYPAFMFIWNILSAVWNAVSQLIGIFIQFVTGQISLPEMLGQIWEVLKQLFSSVLTAIITYVTTWGNGIVVKAINAGRDFVTGVISWIQQLPGKVWTWIVQTATKIIAGGARWVTNARNKAQATVNGVMNWIKQLPGKVYQEFINIGSRILSAGSDLVKKAKQVGQDIVNGILGAMGIHSPGTIQKKISKEFHDMIYQIEDNVGKGYKAAKLVGEDIVNGFQSENVEDALNVMPNVDTSMMDTEVPTPDVDTEIPTTVTAEADMEILNTSESGLSQLVQTTNTAYTAMQSKENSAMNNMLNHVGSSMSGILQKTTAGLNATTNVTKSNLENMNNSTVSVTSKMVSAWETMRKKIVKSADNIRTQSTSHFNKLSSTIGSFYRKLQNPRGWGAGPSSGSSGARGAGRPAGKMSSITSKMAEKLNKGPEFITISKARQSPCIDSSCLDYITPGINGANIKMDDLIRGNCVDCDLNVKNRGGAGWESVVSPNVKYIKDKSRNWSMKGPMIMGKYSTGLSFKVSDFESGTPKIGFSSFKSMAESLFSQIPYDFYYDSEKYGSWQNALAAGRCNCSDGADALIALAHTCGLSAYKQHGHWNQFGHFFAIVNGQKMDTTGWQQRRTWTPSASAGPRPKISDDNDDEGIISRLAKDLQTGKDFDIYTGETVEEVKVEGEVTVKHEFINLPEGITAEEVARLINEAPDDDDWLKKLINSTKFQNIDRKVKKRLSLKDKRSKGV